jgi:hypothetical protein
VGAILLLLPLEKGTFRLRSVKAGSTGIELVLDHLEQEAQLSQSARVELSGLTSHDIWALDDFASKRITTKVADMKPAQRVAARALTDHGLLTIAGDGESRAVVLTPLGRQILDAANSLL